MSGPVDVRKDLNSIASLLEQLRQNNAAIMLDRVSAAVAELIEADREYDTAWADYGMAKTGTPRNEAWDRVQSAISRRKVALANVVSAS